MFGWFRKTATPRDWWKLYPVRGSRLPYPPGPDDHPDPGFAVGTSVRLRGKPAQIRRVLQVEWHWIRREYSYIVETSASRFRPYWFAAQLDVVDDGTVEPGVVAT